jgi:repressor LexA
MNKLQKDFSSNLKHFMKQKKKTAPMLARYLGVSDQTVYSWFNERAYPRSTNIEKIASYLNVTVEQLTGSNMNDNVSAVRIPVLGSVRAGIPLDAIEDVIEWEEIPAEMARTGEYFALQIKRNSMDPRMYEGDVVIVKKQNTIECGQIAIVLVNGYEATCKKIRISNNGITLIGFNPDFQPITYSAVEIMSLPVQIIGRVVECRQKY